MYGHIKELSDDFFPKTIRNIFGTGTERLGSTKVSLPGVPLFLMHYLQLKQFIFPHFIASPIILGSEKCLSVRKFCSARVRVVRPFFNFKFKLNYFAWKSRHAFSFLIMLLSSMFRVIHSIVHVMKYLW